MKRLIIIIMILFFFAPLKAFAAGTTADPIKFTAEEKAFIKEHPTIRLGVDPEFIPYEFIDTDGKYKGISADYIQLLSQKIGIQMSIELIKPGRRSMSWL